MSKLFNINDEERQRIKNLHESRNPHAVITETIISEFIYPMSSVAAAAAPSATQKSEEQKIADGILAATQGAGTNEKNFLASTNKLKDSAQFWNVNSYLKTVGSKLDFAGIVNDEMGNDDGPDVQTIIDKLKTIGITATADINEYNNFKPGTFKITSTGKETATPKKIGSKQSTQSAQSVNTRFVQSAKSLGVQNGKMDLQTLQTILKSLKGESPAATPSQGTPDLAQLTAALNQLKA